MQKIYKLINGNYALFTRLTDGGWVQSGANTNIEKALIDNYIADYYADEHVILAAGWTPFQHDNLEWLVEGDVVEDKGGKQRTILGCHGLGKARMYHLSSVISPFEVGFDRTAHELKECGYKRVTDTPDPDPKISEAIELLKSKGVIKDGKVIAE